MSKKKKGGDVKVREDRKNEKGKDGKRIPHGKPFRQKTAY